MENHRWFLGKGLPISSVSEVDSVEVPGTDRCRLVILEIAYRAHPPEWYLTFVDDAGAEPRVGSGAWTALGDWVVTGGSLHGAAGGIFAAEAATPGGDGLLGRAEAALGDDQSNTLVVLGGSIVLKLYRRLVPGPHPEAELLAALSSSALVPALHGNLAYIGPNGGSSSLAVGLDYIEQASPGLDGPISQLVDFLESHESSSADAAVWDATDDYEAIGAVTGSLHRELQAAFGSRPAVASDLERWSCAARETLTEAIALDRVHGWGLSADASAIEAALTAIVSVGRADLMRIHGDLHLGQFLASPAGPVVIDFEGDPLVPIERRRQKDTPARDLACLLRSVDHVASAAARRVSLEANDTRLHAWLETARRRLLAAYTSSAGPSQLSIDPQLLHSLELAKECAEFIYAARVVPDWAYAPQAGMRRLLGMPELTRLRRQRS